MISCIRPAHGRLLSASVAYTDRLQPLESQFILNQKNLNQSHEKDIQVPAVTTTTSMSLTSTKSIPEDAEYVSSNSLVTESDFYLREARKATSPVTGTSNYADTYLDDQLEEQGLNIDDNTEISKRKMQCAKIDEPLVKHDMNTGTAPPKTVSQGKIDKNIKRLTLPCSKTKSNILNSITTITRKIAPQAAVRFSERMIKLNTTDKIILNRKFDSGIRGTLVHDYTSPEQPEGSYVFPKIGSQDATSLSSISLDSMVSGISLETTGSERNLTPISSERIKDDIYITLDASSRQNSTSNRLITSTSQDPHAETKSPELCLNIYDKNKDESLEMAHFKMDVINTACDDGNLMEIITAFGPPSEYQNGPDEAAKREIWELITDQNSFSKQSEPSPNASSLESEKYSTLIPDLEEMAHKNFESEGTFRKSTLENTHNTRTLSQLGEDSKTGCDSLKLLKEEFKLPDPDTHIKGSKRDYSEKNKQESKQDSIMISTGNLHTRGFQRKEVLSLSLDTENLEPTKTLNSSQGIDNNYPRDTNFQSLDNRKSWAIVPTLPSTSHEILQDSTLLDDFYFDEGNISILQNNSSPSAFDANVFDKDNGMNRDQSTKRIPSSTEVSPCTRVLNPSIPSSASFAHVPKSEVYKSDLQLSNLQSNQTVNNLTEETLEAYQCALASAAFTAAANGKYCRDFNISNIAVSFNEEPNQFGLKKQLSEDTDELFIDDYEDEFDFEDKYQDCDFIAEANAEVLAFDFDGFYGQEFGFYSAKSSDSGSISENGGVFGPVGLDRKRSSQSGRFGSHERNLTPITERSEYSNRNSSMSPCIQSPGSVRDIMSWNSPSSRYDSEK